MQIPQKKRETKTDLHCIYMPPKALSINACLGLDSSCKCFLFFQSNTNIDAGIPKTYTHSITSCDPARHS